MTYPPLLYEFLTGNELNSRLQHRHCKDSRSFLEKTYQTRKTELYGRLEKNIVFNVILELFPIHYDDFFQNSIPIFEFIAERGIKVLLLNTNYGQFSPTPSKDECRIVKRLAEINAVKII
uniref:Uncharacterized protein n=1 Tax=viral metagenome TaxID=1070528 RepID=A0A6C0KIA7_9ZZZZ